jgi:WD40 repeat protein/serine/threonine protein kinase
MTATPQRTDASIFGEALEMKSSAEQAAFLDLACGADPARRQRLEDLLRSHDEAGKFLNEPLVAPCATIAGPSSPESPGTLIGRYKLLQQIGEGGFGTVYMAEQKEPMRRRVALKIIKPGMDTREVIARFEAERQALALMEHPNIARVLDAGTTQSGRPYFVMELVPGISIAEFCDKNRLPTRARLELFVAVCQAVQHAHQKGIIHRDLKPSNILVTLHDGKPVPKVIDFGVAKALNQELTEKTLFTAYGHMIGTPQYMSPEQAEMSGLDVDTRSDIYALGAVLYELLTGTTPLEARQLRAAAYTEMQRLIREEEAPRPSLRVSTLGERLSVVAQERQCDPAQLKQLLRGELDWIVLKALEKDRTRRYETATSLARDLQRYLADEPVEACPPSVSYKLCKLARKHRALLTAAAACATLLLLGVAGSVWQAVRAGLAETTALEKEQDAENERDVAKQERDDAQRQRDTARRLNEQLEAAQTELRATLYAARLSMAQRAWDDGDVVRVLDLLEQHRPKPGEPDLRGFESRYFQRLCRPSQLREVTSSLSAGGNAMFSPDGTRLFTLPRGGTGRKPGGEVFKVEPGLRAYQVPTGQELFKHVLKGGQGQAAILSPDGKRVVLVGLDKTLTMWDVDSGKEVLAVKGADRRFVFSPNGRRLASGFGKEVKVWDANTGQGLRTLQGFTGGVLSLAFSGDGSRLVTVASRRDAKEGKDVGCEVKLWDIQLGKELFTINESADAASYASLSLDGKRLLTYSREAKVWNAQTGKPLFTLKAQGSSFRFVELSPDGKRIVTAEDVAKWPRILVWDAENGQMLSMLQGHGSPIFQWAFSADGKRLASREVERKVLVWDLETGQQLASLRGAGDPSAWNSLAFSPDGKSLALDHGAFGSKDLKIWSWEAGKDRENVTLSGIKIRGPLSLGAPDVGFSPDLERVVGIAGDTVKVWDARSAREITTCKGLSNAILCVAFGPAGKLVAGGDGRFNALMRTTGKPVPGIVKVWDAQTGKELLTLKGHTDSVVRIAFSLDGTRLASASLDNTMKIWDLQTGKEVHSLSPAARIFGRFGIGIAFSPDGKRLAALGQVWDVATGKELFVRKNLPPFTLTYSPDGKRMFSVKGKMYDAQTGQELPLKPLGERSGPGGVIATFSPDGKRLAIALQGQVKLWDVQSGQELLSLKAPSSFPCALAFTPDGHRLGHVTAHGAVTIWDATPLPEKR